MLSVFRTHCSYASLETDVHTVFGSRYNSQPAFVMRKIRTGNHETERVLGMLLPTLHHYLRTVIAKVNARPKTLRQIFVHVLLKVLIYHSAI